MNKYTRMNWENTPSTATPLSADNLNHMDEGIEQATDGVTVVEEDLKTAKADLVEVKSEVETARGDYDNLNARLNGIDTTVGNKADKSTVSQLSARLQSAETTLAGKANATDVNNALKAKEDNSNKVSNKMQITDKVNNYPNIKYLEDNYYDFNELYTSDEVDALLSEKYNSSNIESGTATLTPYESQVDKSKSATCIYKKIGDVVIVNATVTMNAGSLGATTIMHFKNLPFANKTANSVLCVGISNKNGLFRGSVSSNAWLQFLPQGGKAYTFVDGEQISFTFVYQI